MITARFQAENPEEIVMALTLTMPVREWRQLRTQLSSAHPSWKVGSMISDMVLEACQKFSMAQEIPE